MPVPTTTTRQPSSAALYAKLDVLNEAIDALVDVMDKHHPDFFHSNIVGEIICENVKEGRRAAHKTISEAASQLQRQADGTYQEALDAAYSAR